MRKTDTSMRSKARQHACGTVSLVETTEAERKFSLINHHGDTKSVSTDLLMKSSTRGRRFMAIRVLS